jgi:hypothetical protein
MGRLFTGSFKVDYNGFGGLRQTIEIINLKRERLICFNASKMMIFRVQRQTIHDFMGFCHIKNSPSPKSVIIRRCIPIYAVWKTYEWKNSG